VRVRHRNKKIECAAVNARIFWLVADHATCTRRR